MTDFWFIRHGESESNAGLQSDSDLTTPLTEKGMLQAKFVADHITFAPDLFVVSPYLRAIQTSEPTIAKFPETPLNTWPIQEFSYLSHQQYYNTNSKQRGNLSRDFFRKADPDLILGEGGESFNQFIGRIELCLNKIHHIQNEFVILFGHGWFIRATLWHLLISHPEKEWRKSFKTSIRNTIPSSPLALNLFSLMVKMKAKKMFNFLIFSAAVQIPNGGILKLQTTPDKKFEIIDFDLSHLPKNLTETTWRNR